MDDVSFLEQTADADATATLMVLLPDGTVSHIRNVSPFALLDGCPLLYHAFELGANNVQQANIEAKASSRTAVIALLRFLYCGAYLVEQEGAFPSLQLHVEVSKIALHFDVPELQVQANVNFMRETEFACCTATAPPDLCTTIAFIYQNLVSQQLQKHQSLLDTLLNYCVSVFDYQALGSWQAFRDVVFNNPDFHRDLCRVSMQRNFEDAGAMEIMHLPVCRPTPYSQEDLSKRALGDFQFELWQGLGDPAYNGEAVEDNPRPAKARKVSGLDGCFTLVHRPKDPNGVPKVCESESEAESSSDESGFTLVHRPKDEQEAPKDEQGDLKVEQEEDPFATPTPGSPITDASDTVVVPSPSAGFDLESQSDAATVVSDDEWSFI